MKVLIIDNYDSFTYNLYQYVGEVLLQVEKTFTVDVFRNDALSLAQIEERQYDKIIISPGPGDPSDAHYFGICTQVIRKLGTHTPVLGVCLGMQGIVFTYGGLVVRAAVPMHGKGSQIIHDSRGVFKNLPQNLGVMRYHSLVAERSSIPECLEITAEVPGAMGTGEIMGVRHKQYPIEGVQFHPESFSTEGGKAMLKNFLFD